MTYSIKACVSATALSILTGASTAQAETRHVLIDLSGSNPIVSDQGFADMVAMRTAQDIATMDMGDSVTFRTFGQMGLANVRSLKVRLDRRNKPAKVARQIAGMIRSIPKGSLEAQGSTNIIAEFEFNQFDCALGDQITVITDGLEASSYVPNPRKLLDGTASLPAPDRGLLQGCHVTFLGIGQNLTGQWPPQSIKNLRSAWSVFFRAAGATFAAVTNP